MTYEPDRDDEGYITDLPNWSGVSSLPSKTYLCPFCDCKMASNVGIASGGRAYTVYICSHCGRPTFFHGRYQFPASLPGGGVRYLPPRVEELYREVRRAASANAPTASVMAARKLLMNVAVEKTGADEGKTFAFYVDHLNNNGYIPPGGKQLAAHIKDIGNEANHRIETKSPFDAERTIVFVEALLRFIFELPASLLVQDTGEQSSGPQD